MTDEAPVEPQGDPEAEQVQDKTDWKAEARKWEARAKQNSDAAARLAQIEEANKTDLEKAVSQIGRAHV